MTWSYNIALATEKDRVRFLAGDTDTADQQVSDEEIAGLLSLYGGAHRTAAAICRHLAARLGRYADTQIGQLRVSLSARARGFADRADELEAQAAVVGSVPVPYAGGLSIADKQAREDNTDRVRPLFTRDMDAPAGLAPGQECER